jgi:hypothetical protein
MAATSTRPAVSLEDKDGADIDELNPLPVSNAEQLQATLDELLIETRKVRRALEILIGRLIDDE